MEFRLLGELEVARAGEPLALGSEKERALLALLLLHANEFVSGDELIEGLWASPPRTAAHAVEVYVSRLRQRLGKNGARILTRPGGYRLEVDPERIDVHRFEDLAAAGQEARAGGDDAAAAASFRHGLALWRGPPLSDLATEPFAEREAARLNELRLGMLEDALDAELALGRHTELVAELETLVAQHPENERLAAQLMLALYRSGRQADALAAYQTTRNRLHEQLGLEPSRTLRSLEQAILRQDTELELPDGDAISTKPQAGTQTARRHPRPLRRQLPRRAVAMAVAVAFATAVAVLATARLGGGPAPALTANSVGILDSLTGRVVRSAPVSFSPSGVAARGDSVWVVAPSDGNVAEISRKSGVTVQTIHVGELIGEIAIDGGAAWVTRPLEASLARIDLASGRLTQAIKVGKGATGVAYGYRSVWVARPAAQTVTRIDADTGRVIAVVHTPITADKLVIGNGVWASSELDGTLVEIDPALNQVTRAVNVGNGPSALAAGTGSLWVANTIDGTVSRIDPRRGVVRSTVPVAAGPSALAVAAGAVWVADETRNTLVRLNPLDGAVLNTIALPGRPSAIAADGETLAVSIAAGGSAHRGGIVHVIATVGTVRSLDPSLALGAADWAVQSTLADGLATFRHSPGDDGTRLAADLAVALPTPLVGGTVYRFRLRPDVRFSNGTRLRPLDVRSTIERLFRARSPAAQLFAGIVGASQCLRTPPTCSLSDGIRINDHANTVTFHLRAPDRHFLDKLALPFASILPAGTPLPEHGRPVAGTGPYQIAAYQPDQSVTLVRNPWFSAWNSAIRPDGYPDQIVIRLVAPTPREERSAIERVEQGLADLALLPRETPNALAHERRHPARMHIWRAPSAQILSAGQPAGKAVPMLVFLSAQIRDYQQSPITGPLLDQLWLH